MTGECPRGGKERDAEGPEWMASVPLFTSNHHADRAVRDSHELGFRACKARRAEGHRRGGDVRSLRLWDCKKAPVDRGDLPAVRPGPTEDADPLAGPAVVRVPLDRRQDAAVDRLHEADVAEAPSGREDEDLPGRDERGAGERRRPPGSGSSRPVLRSRARGRRRSGEAGSSCRRGRRPSRNTSRRTRRTRRRTRRPGRVRRRGDSRRPPARDSTRAGPPSRRSRRGRRRAPRRQAPGGPPWARAAASGKSAAQVTGPTTPSTLSGVPCASVNRAWKSRTAAVVAASNDPESGSGPQPRPTRARWISRTRVAFFSPALTERPGKGRVLMLEEREGLPPLEAGADRPRAEVVGRLDGRHQLHDLPLELPEPALELPLVPDLQELLGEEAVPGPVGRGLVVLAAGDQDDARADRDAAPGGELLLDPVVELPVRGVGGVLDRRAAASWPSRRRRGRTPPARP